jgi:thiazole synthase
MRIILNGKSQELSRILTLQNLIQQLKENPAHVVAELNGEIIKVTQWENVVLKEGDSIELLKLVGGGSLSPAPLKVSLSKDTDSPLVLAGKTFTSRFLLGTGKFKSKKDLTESITAARSQIVTVALRRIDIERHEDNILEYIPKDVTLLVNTSGARNAQEAIRIARLARESGCGHWIKIEVINDNKYLLPDNIETLKATELLVKEGFVVLPYISSDLYIARQLVKAGAASVMPLGSLIGSNQGLKAKEFIRILIEEIDIPIIVDAGIGTPSQAAEAMEMGADAVLANTAIATAVYPPLLAQAFAMAIEAGRLGYLSKMPPPRDRASASSPLTGFLFEQ